ncbi:MAG: type II toxin-antitoxin system VapC family toxin [Fibrobacteria bacterium]|nr:type II toxin-antitoxin system VapC family toxin [Fibrobacteria bacterium]
MKYLLDASTCLYTIKKAPKKVFEKLSTQKIGDVGISSITYCELQYGVSSSSYMERNQNALNEFLAPIEVLVFPNEAAVLYGDIKDFLKRKNQKIGPLDLLTGIHALHLGVTVITKNVKKFSVIPGLKVENWT